MCSKQAQHWPASVSLDIKLSCPSPPSIYSDYMPSDSWYFVIAWQISTLTVLKSPKVRTGVGQETEGDETLRKREGPGADAHQRAALLEWKAMGLECGVGGRGWVPV